MILLIGLALPSHADHFWDFGYHHDSGITMCIGVVNTTSHVRVIQEDPREELAVYKQWFAEQVRAYADIDEETGEHVCDIAQIVTDVHDGYLLISDAVNNRNKVLVNSRTKIIFPKDSPLQSGTAKLTSILRTGDIITVSGHLQAHDLLAHTMRVVGHSSGMGDDVLSTLSYGARFYGVVETVDIANATLVVKFNDGRRTVLLEHDATVWFDGKQQQLYYLRPGDRIIGYCHDRNFDQNQSVFRIVLLRNTDLFPLGDAPYWADPDAVIVESTVPGPIIEGDVEYITTGVFFDTVYIHTHDGHHERFHFPHSMNVIDPHGHQVVPHDLHAGSTLRVHYSDIGGNHFAHRLDVRK